MMTKATFRCFQKAFSMPDRYKSFMFAVEGIAYAFQTQPHAWVHLCASLTVCVSGFILRISLNDWRWVITCIIFVWVTELINTAFEYLCDVVSPEYNVLVKRAKDIVAGAVLVCAIGSAILGVTIFGPYLWR